MQQQFKFTCVAHSFTLYGGGTYKKGQFLIVSDDDPRLSRLRGSLSFKEESLGSVPERVTPTVSKSGAPPAEENPRLLMPIEEILDSELAVILDNAGLRTVGDVVIKQVDQLTLIKGIGEARAKKILAECNMAAASGGSHLPPKADDDENEDNFED